MLAPSKEATNDAPATLKEQASHMHSEGPISSGAHTDADGRTLGLEDPHDPQMQDDPAILAREKNKARLRWAHFRRGDVAMAAMTAAQAKLIKSTGKPFIDPCRYGGSLTDRISPKSKKGEPLNVIVSALSSPEILTRKGLQGYLRSIDLDIECFHLHSGGAQQAFIDPRGYLDQNFLYREVYTPLDHVFGTCIESLAGGNHIRAWQQMGTGAWFLAASKEENVAKKHMLVPNGYNIGRDWVVRQSQKDGGKTSFMFKTYQTTVQYLDGLTKGGAAGLNHGIAADGRIALLTVTLVSGSGSGDRVGTTAAQGQGPAEQAHLERDATAAAVGSPSAKGSQTTAPRATQERSRAARPDQQSSRTSTTPATRPRMLADKIQKRLSRPFSRLSMT